MAISVASFGQVANWIDTTTPRTIAASWSPGDIIIVVGGGENATNTLGTPTASGLTFNLKASDNSGSSGDPNAFVWASDPAASGGSGNVSGSRTTGTANWGFALWVITGNPSGVTNAIANRSNAAISRAVSAGSIVCYFFNDWQANTTDQTMLTGSGSATERVDGGNGTNYGEYAGEWAGTSAGTFNFGVSSYTGITTAQALIEVLGPSGASPEAPPPVFFPAALTNMLWQKVSPWVGMYLPQDVPAVGQVIVGGVATEADAVPGGMPYVLGGVATESDTAPGGAAQKLVLGGVATESDTAPGGTPAKTTLGAAATESDTAPGGAAQKLVAGSTATESDAAPGGASLKTALGGVATESDAAPGGASLKLVAGAVANENDAALAGAALKRVLGALANEDDAVPGGLALKLVLGGVGTENDTAPAGSVGGAQTIAGGVATEDDAAPAGAALKLVLATGLAAEDDAALAGVQFKVVLGGVATESDTALAGIILGGGVALDPQLHSGFMRDGGPTGPLIIVTEATAQPPLEMHAGFLRDARYYLVTTQATGPGTVFQDMFLRTVSP